MSNFASCEFVNLQVFFLAPTIHKFAKSQLQTDLQNSEKLASCRLGTKPLVGFSLGGLDPLSPLMIERPSHPCQFSDTKTIEIAATVWPNSSPEDGGVWYLGRGWGGRFLGAAARLVAAAAVQRGECLFLLTSAKPQIWVSHLGYKTSDFVICEFVDRWHQKWMDDLQIHNSQLANTEIWDTRIEAT
jgi:hypothetical protein